MHPQADIYTGTGTQRQTDAGSDTYTHNYRQAVSHTEKEQSCLLCFASSSTEE